MPRPKCKLKFKKKKSITYSICETNTYCIFSI